MAVVSKSGYGLEGIVTSRSFKWVLWRRGCVNDDSGDTETGDALAAGKSWITELSPFANVVVRKCSEILGISPIKLQESFGKEACDAVKGPLCFARSFFEYCCFRTLAFWISANQNHLADKNFRLLTYDMMVGWDTPAAFSPPLLNVGHGVTVGKEAFSRLAPAIPLVANVIISENLYEVLSASTNGRLHFPIYEKYLLALERARRRLKSRADSSLLSAMRLSRGENVLEVDGTIISQPILEHVGKYAWPGRITLTDQAIYFEALRVVSYDKAKRYSLTERMEQVIKPELSGPLGTRVFDRAISCKSSNLSEPIIIEFAELKGHSRRDYWLAITKEILCVHIFLDKFQIIGIQREDALSKAILGILRTQAIRNMRLPSSICYETLLMFSLCDELPGGDLILEELARSSSSSIKESCEIDRLAGKGGMYSMSSMQMVSSWGIVSGNNSKSDVNVDGLVVGEIAVGQVSCLERAIKESRNSYKEVAAAQASIDGVKVNGIHANLAVMKELLFPITILGDCLKSLALWDDCLKSWIFCLIFSFIIYRGWLGYAIAIIPLFVAAFVAFTRYGNQGKRILQIKFVSPPPNNSMEQLLAIRNGIALVEGFIQDGNIVLLKFRALLLSSFPQASERFLVALIVLAVIIAFVSCKYIILVIFLDTFTKFSPLRRKTTEKVMRRLRVWMGRTEKNGKEWKRKVKWKTFKFLGDEILAGRFYMGVFFSFPLGWKTPKHSLRDWWLSIPAAPMTVERPGEERKKK